MAHYCKLCFSCCRHNEGRPGSADRLRGRDRFSPSGRGGRGFGGGGGGGGGHWVGPKGKDPDTR